VVVDFTNKSSQQWVLANDAAAPYPGPNAAPLIPQLMRFDVAASTTIPDTSRIPETIWESNNAEPLGAKLQNVRFGRSNRGRARPV
jgi:spore coat protein A